MICRIGLSPHGGFGLRRMASSLFSASVTTDQVRTYKEILKCVPWGEVANATPHCWTTPLQVTGREWVPLTSLAIAMVHPKTFRQYGNLSSLYDLSEIREKLSRGEALFSQEKSDLLREQTAQQLPFIKKIKTLEAFDEEDARAAIVLYEQFVTLMKQCPREMLVPPFWADLAWHAHMCDHKMYVKQTEEYLGSLLDHDDGKKGRQLDKLQQRTEELWQQHFGTNPFTKKVEDYSRGDHFFLWLQHHNSFCSTDCSGSCGGCGGGGD